MKNKISLFILLQFVLVLYWYAVHESTSVIFCEILLCLWITLNKLSKGIVLREVIALHATSIILLMAKIGYLFYPIGNPLSKLWVKYMSVPEEHYFAFTIPGVLFFNLALLWPSSHLDKTDEGNFFLLKFRQISLLLNKANLPIIKIILIGTSSFFLANLLPGTFQYIGFLSFLVTFVGFLMLYFMPNANYRLPTFLYLFSFMMYVTLEGGMFTIVIYMSMTIFSFLFLNVKINFFKKTLLFGIVLFSLITLQNIKGVYRQSVDSQDSNVLLLGTLLANEAKSSSEYFSLEKFFFVYTRVNQGFYVANVMNYIPSHKKYDNGEYLIEAALSSFVPRFLWEDKPKAGGKFTTKYYTGVELVGNTSMNVSPFGEAYGSFGPVIGILYLIFLGLFIRWVYLKIFSLSSKFPFLIFWIPVVFFQVTYSMETDSLQIFNSVIKSCAFIFFIYLIYPKVLGAGKNLPKEYNLN